MGGEPAEKIVTTERRREVVTLHGVTPGVGENGAGDLVLGPFGDDGEAQ